jgi:Ca-activated chloride channel family protein
MPKSLHVQADRTRILADGHTRRQRHLRVEVVAPRRPPRAALSLGIVLDTSGSMAGAKLNLAREGAIRALRSLGADDRLSLVSYSDEVDVLFDSAAAEEPAKRTAEQHLRQLSSGGSTDLCGGWLRGCEQVGLGIDDGRLGRCLLLTDGLANRGITDRSTIVRHASELRRRGVTTSTLGVGRDFDELLLREMAESGGGNFYFAENASQLSDFIVGETGEALKVAAREATLVVDLPSGASLFCPNGFRIRSEESRSVVELGDLVADQVLSLVLTVEFPGGTEGEEARVQCWLWDPGGVLEGSADLEFLYSGPQAYAAEPRDREVDRDAMAAHAAAARRRAATLGREGHPRRGREVLQRMAGDIRRHARGDPKLVALAAELEQEAAGLEKMDSLDYKRLEYTSFGALRSKGEDGFTLGTMAFTSRTLNLMMQAERHGPALAPSYVVAVTTDKEGTRLVEAAGRALAAADPHSFAYTVVDGGARVLDSGPGVALSRDDELGLAYALATTSDGVKIAFVRGSLADGSSSHWHAGEKVAIVSLSAWTEGAGVPAEAFVAYEMVRHGLRPRCPGWDPNVPMHSDGRKCWGDRGGSPADIEAKIAAGDLCPGCRRLCEAAGADVEQLLSLAVAVRQLGERPAGVPS